MAGFSGWRVRRGARARGFSDGLVVQSTVPGSLDLSVYRMAEGRGSPDVRLLGPLVAACTSEGIRRDTGIISWLHWPNLVTIDGHVVARTTLNAEAPHESGIELTFGISVDCYSSAPPASPGELPATSIRDALGVEIDVDMLRDKVLHALEWYYAEWERGMKLKLVKRIEPTISWLGREVDVTTVGGLPLRGRARALDGNGSLLLEVRQRSGGTRTLALSPEDVALVKAK